MMLDKNISLKFLPNKGMFASKALRHKDPNRPRGKARVLLRRQPSRSALLFSLGHIRQPAMLRAPGIPLH